MDLVRSCYTTTMRFFRDDPLEIKVRWFFADEEADVFPHHHLFGSGNWASDRFNWPGPGEVLDAPRPWADGAAPDGLIGDHFCGPLVSYIEGDVYPGRPLNGLPDGRCACCVPLPPVCSEFSQTLPATLRLRILDIQLDPPTAPASAYVIGQEFDFVSSGGPNPQWVITVPLSRNGCPFTGFVTLGCAPVGDDTVFRWLLQETQGNYPATLIQEAPLRIFFSFVPINGDACAIFGDGVETWDVVVFDPANPPP